MIREATLHDIEAVVEMGERFYLLTAYAEHMSFDPDVFAETVEHMIGDDLMTVLVATREGVVRGMAGGVMFPLYMVDAFTGQELFWWDESGQGTLLRESLEEWARHKGAVNFHMSSLAGPHDEAFARLYRQAGYSPAEHLYVRAF